MKKLFFIFIFLLSFTIAQDRMATISGNCYLQNQTDHSDIKVLFTALSPSAITDSIFTSEIGAYTVGLSEGIYSVQYSKDEFEPFALSEDLFFYSEDYVLEDVELLQDLFALSGSVSGEWFGNVYIDGHVYINPSDTLFIHPGTEVIFLNSYSTLKVEGTLLSMGSEDDMITFTSLEEPPADEYGWQGIKFYNDDYLYTQSYGCQDMPNDFDELNYFNISTGDWDDISSCYSMNEDSSLCISWVDYCNQQPECYHEEFSCNGGDYTVVSSNEEYGWIMSNSIIQYSIIENAGNAITIDEVFFDNIVISNNIIRLNKYNGILVSGFNNNVVLEANLLDIVNDESNINIFDNIISDNNDSGMMISSRYVKPSIFNNEIINNDDRGIYIIDGASAIIDNNLIADNNDDYNNACGIQLDDSWLVTISNNTIINNDKGIYAPNHSWDSPIIMNNHIINNTGTGISLGYLNCYQGTYEIPQTIISNNIISENGAGINNTSYGCSNSTGGQIGQSIISNNTIINNNYFGINSTSNGGNQSGWKVMNNIINGNGYGVSGFQNITYNNVWNNIQFNISSTANGAGEFITLNANGTPSDTYYNISEDALFIGPDDYNLQSNSPCIDAGNPSEEHYDIDGTIADIGALLYYQGSPNAPDIEFSASITNGISPLSVQFNYINSGGPINTYLWNFGDGTTSTSANPIHTFTSENIDTFSVYLSVEGPGGSDVFGFDDLITILPATFPPLSNFTSDTQMSYGAIQFIAQSSGDVDTYDWSFGDENTSNEQNPLHNYNQAGIYSVSLTVTGPNGSNTETKNNYIHILEAEMVVADFSLVQEGGFAPFSAVFINNSMGNVDSFEWDFGDDSFSYDINPVHTYAQHGEYSIRLIANGIINSDTTYRQISVLSPLPTISSIYDIPSDQGGFVYLDFIKSGWDDASPNRSEIYQIERLEDNDEWVGVASYVAYGEDDYTVIVPTNSDSSGLGIAMNTFRIIASMDEGIWLSAVDSGYSVDNIHPSTPDDVVASATGNDVNLSWDYTQDIDFSYHEVSQIGEPVYTISNEVTMLLDTDYNEYYIKSVDSHDNYSDKSDDVGAHNLHSGANLVSFSVLPDDNSINNVITGDILGVIGEGVAAVPNPALGWVGSLGSIDRDRGYWVKASGAQIHFTTGEKSYVENYDLHAGANLISYTCSGGGSVLDLVTQDCVVGIIGEGVAAAPNPVLGWVGSLSDLMPGKGYWFKTDQDCQVSYDCPEPSLDQLSRDNNDNSIKDYIQSTEQAFYFIEHIENIEVGDMVSAYCNDIKVGSREWIGAYTDIPAMGNDDSDLTKYYCTSSSTPTFRVEKANGETYSLTGDIPVWESNALHMLSTLQEAIILPESYSLAAAYPNPFNPTTTISFAIPADTDVSIAVYNLQGRQIASLASGSYDAGYYSVIWNADTHSSGVYFVKMVAGSYVNTQKLMLVK